MPVQESTPPARRSVVVVDEALPPGLAANAAAVLAVSLGATAPDLVGDDLVDADGDRHPGLITTGLPVLRAPAAELTGLRTRALDAGVAVIGFPAFGQRTTDYAAFGAQLARTPSAALAHLGLVLHGPRRTVARLTGSLPLLR